jgi:hypothetical protein
VHEVTKLTGKKSKSKAVNQALDEYVRHAKIHKLLNLAGKIQIDKNAWKELEELELREAHGHR